MIPGIPLLEDLRAFDTETHLIQAGLLTPPEVCGSVADSKPDSERLLTPTESDAVFTEILDSEKTIGGANLVYDFGVKSARDPANVDRIFKALDEGRAISTDVLEALHDIGRGCLFKNPETGAPFKRYSLNLVAERLLGLDLSAEKYGENSWRLRYALLEGKPFSEWPQEAVDYPRGDARHTFDALAKQIQEGRLNLQCSITEMRAAWFLQLACIWGLRSDPALVKKVVGDIRRKHEEDRRAFVAAGIVRVRKCTNKKDKDGNVEREAADAISLEDVDTFIASLPPEETWAAMRVAEFLKARAQVEALVPVRFAEDKKRLADLVSAAYKGQPPLTEKGAVSTSRDACIESGDELLTAFGEAGANETLYKVFADVIELGTKVPINPEANLLVKSGRTSYRTPNLQQLPRKGLIRENFVPRGPTIAETGRPVPGSGWLFCSGDFATVELCTLAQVCIYAFPGQRIRMAEAIQAGQDLHTRLAARVLGMTYEDALAQKKTNKLVADIRQAMKPVNFGLPGLMGPVTLVATARKDGVRFCILAGLATKCGVERTMVDHNGNPCAPTCVLCLGLAIKYRELWREEWPEMVDYLALAVKVAKHGERGEPLVSAGNGMLRLEGNPNAVANHYFQNLAVQGAKAAGYLVSKEAYTDRKSVLFNNCRVAVFVHDENLAEVREAVAHEAAFRMCDVMREGMQPFTPDIPIKVEPALCRRWFKGADKALDKSGRLKPWWPSAKDWDWPPDQEQAAIDRAA